MPTKRLKRSKKFTTSKSLSAKRRRAKKTNNKTNKESFLGKISFNRKYIKPEIRSDIKATVQIFLGGINRMNKVIIKAVKKGKTSFI